MMGKTREFLNYLSVGIGLAFATCSFTMFSQLFSLAGTGVILAAILLAGAICVAISFSVAEVASMYPSAPGVRTYLKVTFGNRISLFFTFLYIGFLALVAGVEGYMLALVVKAVVPGSNTLLVVMAIMGTATCLNFLGIQIPETVQVVSTFVMIAAVLALGVFGLHAGQLSILGATSLQPAQGAGLTATLAMATGLAIFLFIGFEWIAPMGRGPESYGRLIPIAMPASVVINVVVNGLLAASLGAMLESATIASSSIPHVAYYTRMLGALGPATALSISALASFSTFNAGLMGGARFLYALGRDGSLPGWISTMWLRTGVPVYAVAILASISLGSAIVIMETGVEKSAATVASAIICLIYGALMYSVIALRKRKPNQLRKFRNPVPGFVQWGFAIALPLLGALSLFSEPALGYHPLSIFAGMAMASLVLLRVAGRKPAAAHGAAAGAVVAPASLATTSIERKPA